MRWEAEPMTKSKERYVWYKAHGICVSCGQDDAAVGYVRCFGCLEKERNYSRQYRQSDEHRETKKQRDLRRIEERKSKGQCIACNRMAVQGKIRCQFHLAKDAGRHKHVEWKPPGECLYCTDPRVEGKKLCQKHLTIAQKSISNARNHINREEHPWRQQMLA